MKTEELETIIQAITSALHSGRIEPHESFTSNQIRLVIDEAFGPCRKCGEQHYHPIRKPGGRLGHEFRPMRR